MTWPEAITILFAGAGAGAVNTVVGSGTLITFPVLLAFGYPPVTANVSNGIGLVPGSVSGAWAYRAELAGQGRRALRLGAASVAGAVAGAIALLAAPASAFDAIVPAFIALALVLIVAQPRLVAALADRPRSSRQGRLLTAGVFVTGIYGGYFGAAQGILLLAMLGIGLEQSLHRSNALKNVLAGLVNLVSGLIFVVFAHVAWSAVGVIAVGAVIGAQIGGRYGRRIPPGALRALIVVIGLIAIAHLTVL
jgi:uncharacterized membrane protein YfcA